jgi:hypothetical protein
MVFVVAIPLVNNHCIDRWCSNVNVNHRMIVVDMDAIEHEQEVLQRAHEQELSLHWEQCHHRIATIVIVLRHRWWRYLLFIYIERKWSDTSWFWFVKNAKLSFSTNQYWDVSFSFDCKRSSSLLLIDFQRNPNALFMQCCIDRGLPDACLEKCTFSSFTRDAVQHSITTNFTVIHSSYKQCISKPMHVRSKHQQNCNIVLHKAEITVNAVHEMV